MLRSKIKTVFLAIIVVFLTFSLIAFPEHSLQASIRGLNMWLEVVFPSLLPFFIVAELLIGFGIVNFIGVLLEPLMRPLFRVPGSGGFVWAMGIASGYPVGAKLTARLRQERQITQVEAERLVSFTNSSNPLFIFGAVAVGFFKNVKLGVILAIAHYLGNLTVGILMRFYRSKDTERNNYKKIKFPSIKKALSSLHQTRLKDNRPIGRLLGDSVISSINTLLMIGGFIILFSVINKLLFHLQITVILGEFISLFLNFFKITSLLSIPLISGLFEITLGSQLSSEVLNASLLQKAVITSFILAFSGLSVQAQVASILAQTDIRFQPFFIARIVHAFLASFYTVILWEPIYENFLKSHQATEIVPVFLLQEQFFFTEIYNYIANIGPLVTIISLFIYIIVYTRRNLIK